MNQPDLSIFNPSWDGANESLCINVYDYYNWWNDFKSQKTPANNLNILAYFILGSYSLFFLYHLYISLNKREFLFLLNSDNHGKHLQMYVYLLFSSISFCFHFFLLAYIFSQTCNRSWPNFLFITSQTFELLVMKPIYLFIVFVLYTEYKAKFK